MKNLISFFILLVPYITGNAQSDFSRAYGIRCSMTFEVLPRRDTIESFIANKDTVSINLWLFSTDREQQTYGYEALIRLKKEGLLISENQENGISTIRKMKEKIVACGGCLFWEMTPKRAVKRFGVR